MPAAKTGAKRARSPARRGNSALVHRAVPCLDLGALFRISIMAFGSPALHSWESLTLAAPGGNHTSSIETLVDLVEMRRREVSFRSRFRYGAPAIYDGLPSEGAVRIRDHHAAFLV